jgi:hypothetical protein
MASRFTSPKKPVIVILIAGLLVFAFLLVQPLPRATLKNCIEHKGAVASVSEGPSADIVIRLKNDHTFYYINRGVENGLRVNDLEKLLLNRQVQLLTIQNPIPLSGPATSMHIAQLKFNDSIIYSEL